MVKVTAKPALIDVGRSMPLHRSHVGAGSEHRCGDVNLVTEQNDGTWPSVSRMMPPTVPVTAPIATATSAGAPTSIALTVPATVTSANPKASNAEVRLVA